MLGGQRTGDNRARVAAIVTVWETAQEYVSKEIELRAEAKVLGQPRVLQVHERQAMVKAVENIYGTLAKTIAQSGFKRNDCSGVVPGICKLLTLSPKI